MPTRTEVFTALYATYCLARGDAAAIDYFENSLQGFWKSFFAAVLIAPFYLLLLIGDFRSTADADLNALRYFSVEAIGYVIAWIALPLLMIPLADALDRRQHYYRFLVAYNWSAVLQHLIYLPLSFLILGGLIPEDTQTPLKLTALVLVRIYIWFIARTGLSIPGINAAGIVFIDFVVGFGLNMVIFSMR